MPTEVSQNQLRRMIHRRIREAGGAPLKFPDGEVAYYASLGERMLAEAEITSWVGQRLRANIAGFQVKDEDVFFDLKARLDHPTYLQSLPSPAPAGTRFVPWGHISLSATLRALVDALSQQGVEVKPTSTSIDI
jgi:hypothetical protein